MIPTVDKTVPVKRIKHHNILAHSGSKTDRGNYNKDESGNNLSASHRKKSLQISKLG